MTPQRTIIVTGAGTGIGQATAARLQRKGWRVFATMRRPDPVRYGPDALALDVTSDASVAETVAEVMKRTGRIDAIVNNAGVDIVGAVEETSRAEAEALFQTNFFGVHRLIRAVLPIMRTQGHGCIVTVGSIAGFIPTPFDAFYCASKHALEGYIETLANEVAPLGVCCVLIEPGFIKTELRGKKTDVAERIDAYAVRRAKIRDSVQQSTGQFLVLTGRVPVSLDRTMMTEAIPRLRTCHRGFVAYAAATAARNTFGGVAAEHFANLMQSAAPQQAA